jgi:hypothetical protein
MTDTDVNMITFEPKFQVSILDIVRCLSNETLAVLCDEAGKECVKRVTAAMDKEEKINDKN